MTGYLIQRKKTITDKLKYAGTKVGCALRCFGAVSLMPYMVATTVRAYKEEGHPKFLPDAPTPSAITGVGLGIGGLVGQLVLYSYLAQNNHAEVLAIPVITNVISMGYEAIRDSRKNAGEVDRILAEFRRLQRGRKRKIQNRKNIDDIIDDNPQIKAEKIIYQPEENPRASRVDSLIDEQMEKK